MSDPDEDAAEFAFERWWPEHAVEGLWARMHLAFKAGWRLKAKTPPRPTPEGWQTVLKACVDLLEDATNGARYDNETKAIAQARAMLAAAPPTEPCGERFSDEELELMNDALAQLREGGEKNKRRANLLELAMTRARFPNPTEPCGLAEDIEAAKRALAEPGSKPWETIKEELGLRGWEEIAAFFESIADAHPEWTAQEVADVIREQSALRAANQTGFKPPTEAEVAAARTGDYTGDVDDYMAEMIVKNRMNQTWDGGIEAAANVAASYRSDNPYPTVYAAIAEAIRALKKDAKP